MTDHLAFHNSIRLAFQHSRHAGIIVAPDSPRWTILDVNDAYLAVTHRTRAALVGRPLFEQFPESDATRDDGGSRTLAESFVEALRGGPTAMPTRRYDLPVPGKPGTFHEHYWDFCTTALRDGDGTIVALLHEVENVTARVGIEGERLRLAGELEERNEVMRAQTLELELTNRQLQTNAVELVAQAEELQATGAQLKERTEEAEEAKRRADTERARAENVLETMGDAYFALDSAFRFTRVNAAMEIGAAVSRHAIMGRTIWEVFPGTVGTEFERHYRAAALGTPVHFTHDYSDGRLELVADVDAYHADGGGIAVFWRNVTPRIRADAALRTKEEDLRTLANTLPTLAWTTRPDGYIDWYNDRWYAYTGTTPKEMEGWGWQSVHHPDVLMHVLEQWADAIATGKSFEMTFPLRAADGTFRRFLTRATPLLDASGAILRWFGVNFDIEEEQAAREAVQTVVEAVTDGFVALDSSLRYTYVNQRAAEMWGCKAETLLGKSPVEIWPELDMENTPLLQLMRRVLTTQRTESLRAFAVSLDRWIELRVYPATNGGIVAFFQDITDQRRAEQAAMILAEASQLLASSTDYSQTLANMARAVVPRLGDWAAVDLVIDATDDGWPPQLERVAIVHDDEDKLALVAELTSKYPERWDDPNGMAGVIREGRAMYIPDVTDDMLVLGAKDAEHLRLLRALEFRSIIVVPITARNRVLGALTLYMTESRRQYVDGDLALARDLGQRAGVALDTVRLLRDTMDARAAAEAAAERTARLQDVTSALTSALTEEEVTQLLVTEGVPAFGASEGVIYLLTEDERVLEYATGVGLPDAATQEYAAFSVDSPLPVADAIRSGDHVVLETREAVMTRYPMLASANPRSGAQSWIAVPMRAGETTLGGLMLGFREERSFSQQDRSFAQTLARLGAQALLRARLFDAAQRARAAAEEANAAKMTFLATMSHELRTPLNAIAGHVQIMEMELHGPVTVAQRDALARVSKAQRHLLGLINDILTYAKVESGRTSYDLVALDVAEVVTEACQLVEPRFLVKHISLQVELAKGTKAPLVLADRDKLGQVVLNLLSNGLKFTPSGGAVTVMLATPTDASDIVQLIVSDTGVGIPADRLDSIFEPFVQLGRGLSSGPEQEGTGLGLSISRDLARGMGGNLVVTSAPGRGSTFTLSLARA